MSDIYAQSDPVMKDLKICPKCNGSIRKDIFVLDYGRKKKRGEPGLTECRFCSDCKIIYERIA